MLYYSAMGKPKPPPENSAAEGALLRGISAYKKTLGKDSDNDNNSELPQTNNHTDDIPRESLLIKTSSPKPVHKTLKPPSAGKEATGKIKLESSKYKRAAQFMLLIGSDEASKILSRLDSAQVEAISKEIVGIKSIRKDEAEAVLEEFRSLLSPTYGFFGSSSGGVDEARRLLYAAFGAEKGESLLVKAVPSAAENPFDFLSGFTGKQLSVLFKSESTAACAMVFSRLPASLTAAALAEMSPNRKLDIVRRIARLNDLSPEVIQSVAAALKEKAHQFGRSDSSPEIDGKNVLAEILKHSDLSFGGRLLEELEYDDPELSREMKDRLYTLDDIVNASDRPIQEKLRTMSDREIALLLRGKTNLFTQKIMLNLSSGRAQQITDESEIMGSVPKFEVDAAARNFLAWFRLNREAGHILMLNDEDILV